MQPRRRLEQLRRFRQVAVWAPVVWFPLALYCLLVDRVNVSIGLGLAGIVFSILARAVVWSARCPACDEPFRSSPAGFRQIWDEASCAACGLSLFELRRGRASD